MPRPSKERIIERNQDIKKLLARGKSARKIAEIVGCSPNTVLKLKSEINLRNISYRDEINKLNAERIENFLDIKLTEDPSKVNTSFKLWVQNYGKPRFGREFPYVGPELIWVGKNYGRGMIPKICFIGYSPRFDGYQMGFYYSLCKLKKLDPKSYPKLELMSEQDWDYLKEGKIMPKHNSTDEVKYSGYKEFAYMTNYYNFNLVIEYILPDIPKELYNDILDNIAISNAFIFPGPEDMENPDNSLKQYQYQSKVFDETVRTLRPDIVFIFSKKIWNTIRLWYFDSEDGEETKSEWLWRVMIKDKNGNFFHPIFISIPHFYYPSTNGHEGGSIEEVLDKIQRHLKKTKWYS